MSRNILATLTAASALLLLGACGTTPEEQPTTASEQQQSKAAQPAPSANPTERKPVARSNTQSPAFSPKVSSGIPAERSIYYDYDNFDIKDEYRGVVAAHVKYLRENPGAKVLIQGHADERGSREYNVALGQRRAESVKKMSSLLGVSESRIEAVSFGEEKPLCMDHAEDCWWKNRRSDIRYAHEQ